LLAVSDTFTSNPLPEHLLYIEYISLIWFTFELFSLVYLTCSDVNAIRHLYLVNCCSISTRTISLLSLVVQSDTDLLATAAQDGNDEYSTSLLSPSRGSPVAANIL
jgi:hypothetical protein